SWCARSKRSRCSTSGPRPTRRCSACRKSIARCCARCPTPVNSTRSCRVSGRTGGSMSLGASPSDPSGVLDAGALARLADLDPGNGDLVRKVLATYGTALERTRGELKQAREPRQPEALRHLAHTLKSSSASVGALALSALCAQVEQHVRSQQT